MGYVYLDGRTRPECGRDLESNLYRHARQICLAWQLLISTGAPRPLFRLGYYGFDSVFGQLAAPSAFFIRLFLNWSVGFGKFSD